MEGENFTGKTIFTDEDKILEVRMKLENESADAINCTHSRARWAMRTLIPFQAVSPLQNKIK